MGCAIALEMGLASPGCRITAWGLSSYRNPLGRSSKPSLNELGAGNAR